MTRPEQPKPYPGDVLDPPPGTVRWRKVYRDALYRPMTGTVTFTGTARHDDGELTVLPAPVPATLTGGVLQVYLPPDTYEYVAALRTVEGNRADDRGTITLT